MVSITVCLDLDGVLAYYDGWISETHIGHPNPEGVKLAKMLRDADMRIIVDTCRLNHCWEGCDYVASEKLIRQWLKDNDIPFDELWTRGGKPFADIYVDDRGVHFPSNVGSAELVFAEIMDRLNDQIFIKP